MATTRGKNIQRKYQHIEVHYATFLEFRKISRSINLPYNSLLKEMIKLWKEHNGTSSKDEIST